MFSFSVLVYHIKAVFQHGFFSSFTVLSLHDDSLQFACMEVIRRWLSGSQNFFIGRLYYNQFGKDKNLKLLFDKGETTFAKAELVKALQALTIEEKKPIIKSLEDTRIDKMPKGEDDVTTAIELKWRPMYQRMNYLRHELDKYGDDNGEKVREECRIISQEILELEQKCNQCWEKLDYYKLHKQLPETKNNEFKLPQDPVDLASLIQTLKRNIRRNKQKMKDHLDNSIYPALVLKYEEQLNTINSRKTNDAN